MSKRKKNEQYDIDVEDCPEWSINDYETEDFQYGRGEFSLEADFEFENHLRRIKQNPQEKMWYGRR